jgi:hypothetical protein
MGGEQGIAQRPQMRELRSLEAELLGVLDFVITGGGGIGCGSVSCRFCGGHALSP